MNKKKATGILGSMLAKQDAHGLERTRNRMLLAMKIEIAMRENGLSQKQFANKMDKTESEISEWLSGNRNFTVDTLTDIEMTLGIRLLNTHSSNAVTFPVQVSYKRKSVSDNPVKFDTKGKNEIGINSDIKQVISNNEKFLMVG